MKPITITNWGLLYISLGFVAFVYAIPDNIMSYGLAQNLVELTASIIPAMEKLRQAYEQQYVTGIALFFHALKWALGLMLLMALPILKAFTKGAERNWLVSASAWRLIVVTSIITFGWILQFIGAGIDELSSGYGVGRFTAAMYLFAPTMGLLVCFHLLAIIGVKEILIALTKRKL